MTVNCGLQVSLPGNRRRVARGVNAYETFHQTMVFNRADSIAEDHCLRGALVDGCTQVIALTKPIKREAGMVKSGYGGLIELTVDQMANPSAGIDHAAVVSAYGTWISKSRAAFDRAIAHVEANGTTSDHKDVSEDVIYILQRYKRFALECPAPTDKRMWDFEADFWLTAEQAQANKAKGGAAVRT